MTLAQVVRKRGFSALLLCFHILTTAQYIADLFSAVSDLPSVINASFPAMLSYADPDYWLGALLSHSSPTKKVPWSVRQGCPVIGFPESDNKITDLQINVPPAASWLAALIGVPRALLPYM